VKATRRLKSGKKKEKKTTVFATGQKKRTTVAGQPTKARENPFSNKKRMVAGISRKKKERGGKKWLCCDVHRVPGKRKSAYQNGERGRAGVCKWSRNTEKDIGFWARKKSKGPRPSPEADKKGYFFGQQGTPGKNRGDGKGRETKTSKQKKSRVPAGKPEKEASPNVGRSRARAETDYPKNTGSKLSQWGRSPGGGELNRPQKTDVRTGGRGSPVQRKHGSGAPRKQTHAQKQQKGPDASNRKGESAASPNVVWSKTTRTATNVTSATDKKVGGSVIPGNWGVLNVWEYDGQVGKRSKGRRSRGGVVGTPVLGKGGRKETCGKDREKQTPSKKGKGGTVKNET